MLPHLLLQRKDRAVGGPVALLGELEVQDGDLEVTRVDDHMVLTVLVYRNEIDSIANHPSALLSVTCQVWHMCVSESLHNIQVQAFSRSSKPAS